MAAVGFEPEYFCGPTADALNQYTYICIGRPAENFFSSAVGLNSIVRRSDLHDPAESAEFFLLWTILLLIGIYSI